MTMMTECMLHLRMHYVVVSMIQIRINVLV